MTTTIWLLSCSFGIFLAGLALAFLKFKLARLDMTFLEFSRRLIRGGGYKRISPRELDEIRRSGLESTVIVDLRERRAAQSKPFPNSISSPFDEFLKEVVVEKNYRPDDPIVLVCDTGQMSRVAANILVEDEEFTDVYNLNGGVASWERWLRKEAARQGCCAIERLAMCCN
jgi:rhodanese-related sulfurtransferase